MNKTDFKNLIEIVKTLVANDHNAFVEGVTTFHVGQSGLLYVASMRPNRDLKEFAAQFFQYLRENEKVRESLRVCIQILAWPGDEIEVTQIDEALQDFLENGLGSETLRGWGFSTCNGEYQPLTFVAFTSEEDFLDDNDNQ